MDKIYLDKKRLTRNYAIAIFILAVVLFFVFFKIFIYQTWSFIQPVIIGAFVLLAVIFYIVTIKTNYYILNDYSITVRKFSKEIEYSFSDIIYIDKEQSERKKTVIFYGVKSHERYLPFDKDGIIYSTICKKCKKLLTKEEFKKQYPKVDL